MSEAINNFSQNEAPDQDFAEAKDDSPKFNAQRDRDRQGAGVRGSNHVGQGSGGDTTHFTPSAAKEAPARAGNSTQSPGNEKQYDKDTHLGEGTAKDRRTEEELNKLGGTERADMGYTAKGKQQTEISTQP